MWIHKNYQKKDGRTGRIHPALVDHVLTRWKTRFRTSKDLLKTLVALAPMPFRPPVKRICGRGVIEMKRAEGRSCRFFLRFMEDEQQTYLREGAWNF